MPICLRRSGPPTMCTGRPRRHCRNRHWRFPDRNCYWCSAREQERSGSRSRSRRHIAAAIIGIVVAWLGLPLIAAIVLIGCGSLLGCILAIDGIDLRLQHNRLRRLLGHAAVQLRLLAFQFGTAGFAFCTQLVKRVALGLCGSGSLLGGQRLSRPLWFSDSGRICFSMAARRSLRFIDVFNVFAASLAALASARLNASRDCMELINSCVLVEPVTTLITVDASEPCRSSRAICATAACASS